MVILIKSHGSGGHPDFTGASMTILASGGAFHFSDKDPVRRLRTHPARRENVMRGTHQADGHRATSSCRRAALSDSTCVTPLKPDESDSQPLLSRMCIWPMYLQKSCSCPSSADTTSYSEALSNVYEAYLMCIRATKLAVTYRVYGERMLIGTKSGGNLHWYLVLSCFR